jgi:CrcB protein
VTTKQLGVVLGGGFLGGLARYETVTHWSAAAGTIPWSTFAVNTAGAFILGLVVIVVLEVFGPSKYFRLLVGTGFCGALTTFSSVAVQIDELAAHGHLGGAIVYGAASLVAGLTAVALGAALGHRLPPTAARQAMTARGT